MTLEWVLWFYTQGCFLPVWTTFFTLLQLHRCIAGCFQVWTLSSSCVRSEYLHWTASMHVYPPLPPLALTSYVKLISSTLAPLCMSLSSCMYCNICGGPQQHLYLCCKYTSLTSLINELFRKEEEEEENLHCFGTSNFLAWLRYNIKYKGNILNIFS